MAASENLDRLTKTFQKDQEYFAAIVRLPAFDPICQMLVFYRWCARYLNPLHVALCKAVNARFPSAQQQIATFWIHTLFSQIGSDLSLTVYLSLRGLHDEAGTPLRRCLENLGLLAHLW